MILDLASLQTLVAAVDLKGFGKAAERLHRSPAAVSVQMKALDAVLTECGRFPGPIWDLGANFVRHTLRRPAGPGSRCPRRTSRPSAG